MGRHWGIQGVIAAGALSLLSADLHADITRRGRPVLGATLREVIEPSKGFIDDACRIDNAAEGLLFVRANTSDLTELVDYKPAELKTAKRIDISKLTSRPVSVDYALAGKGYFLTFEGDKGLAAAVIDSNGRTLERYGPATDIVQTTYKGKPAVVVYRQTQKKSVTDHEVSAFEVGTKKRIGKATTLSTDANGKSADLDFSLKYWRHDYTVAVGIKGGVWDKKEDQRSPDVEGWYDLPDRSWVKSAPIKNVVRHREKLELYAEHDNEQRFVQMARNLSNVYFYSGLKRYPLKLAEPVHHYKHDSLQYKVHHDGTVFFIIEIDSVNRDAVARKRAIKPWIDLYEIPPGATRPVRRARILGGSKKEIDWHATHGHLVVQPSHLGFDRGGERLYIFTLNQK